MRINRLAANLLCAVLAVRTTGPEIWHQTDGKVTHFIDGADTGGTLSGVKLGP